MYMGPITEEPPIAKPPITREKSNTYQFQANAHPSAEST